jgi:hypothetical protein
VLVALYGTDGTMTAFGATNGDGAYTFAGRAPGHYLVRMWEPFDRVELPDVRIPVVADSANPAAGEVSFQVGRSPVLTSGAPPSRAVVARPYSFRFTASGDPRPTFSLESGSLPRGLALKPDGTLSGTPQVAGTYRFVVRAASSAGAVISDQLRIDVAKVPTPPRTPRDTTPPSVSRLRVRKAAERRLAVTLSVDESATLRADALVAARTAKRLHLTGARLKLGHRRYILLGRSKPVLGNGPAELTIRLSKKNAKRLRHQRKLALLLRVTAIDSAGNDRVAAKSVKLRR